MTTAQIVGWIIVGSLGLVFVALTVWEHFRKAARTTDQILDEINSIDPATGKYRRRS